MIVERSGTRTTLMACLVRCWKATLQGAWRSGDVGEDPQVAAARAAAVVRRVARGLGTGRLADRVGEREQVVAGRAGVVEVDLVTDDLPAAGHGQPLRVELAQVVAVRLREGRQRADNGRGLRVHVGQSRRCRLRAATARAAT